MIHDTAKTKMKYLVFAKSVSRLKPIKRARGMYIKSTLNIVTKVFSGSLGSVAFMDSEAVFPLHNPPANFTQSQTKPISNNKNNIPTVSPPRKHDCRSVTYFLHQWLLIHSLYIFHSSASRTISE